MVACSEHRCHHIARRSVVIGGPACLLAVGLAPPAHANAIKGAPRDEDERFMRIALHEAALGDYPFGAAIIKDGRVLSVGHNSVHSTNDPTGHGEIAAIRNFTAANPAEKLQGTTIYTTAEPCAMCMGAIVWSGFGRLVYAASLEDLLRRFGQINLTSEAVAAASPFAHVEITGGVLAEEALALLAK